MDEASRAKANLARAGFAAYVDRRDRLWIGYTSGRAILHTAVGAQLFSSGEPGLGYVYAFLDTIAWAVRRRHERPGGVARLTVRDADLCGTVVRYAACEAWSRRAMATCG